MPLKSKAQLRKLGSLEAQGKVAPGTVKKWVEHTPGSVKDLPERLHKKDKK